MVAQSSKVALVTGAAAGVGEAVARALAARGWRVIVAGRRAGKLQRLKAGLESEYGTEVLTLPFDICDRRQCEAALGSLAEKFRRVELLVNNAAVAHGEGPLHEGDPLEWERMIDTNVKGLLYVTRAVAVEMSTMGSGRIINIVGQFASQDAVYLATQQAARILTQRLGEELAPKGIRVEEATPENITKIL